MHYGQNLLTNERFSSLKTDLIYNIVTKKNHGLLDWDGEYFIFR